MKQQKKPIPTVILTALLVAFIYIEHTPPANMSLFASFEQPTCCEINFFADQCCCTTTDQNNTGCSDSQKKDDDANCCDSCGCKHLSRSGRARSSYLFTQTVLKQLQILPQQTPPIHLTHAFVRPILLQSNLLII